MTFTYDGGLVTEMAWNGVANGTYRYRYDNNFSLVGMQLDDEPEIEMKRDADGLLTQYGQFQVVRNQATGAPTQITDGKMNVDIEYDNSGRVISRTNLVNGRVIYQLQLSYDVLSRIVQKRETVTGTTHIYDYTYDLDGQLILVKCDGEIVERYVYDDNGNRTEWQLGTQQHTASYDAQDRLIELDGTPYEFDADGFLMQRGDMTLKYSATGELLEVSWPDGKAINYTYDSMNRRVARTDEKGTVQYLYGNPNHPFQVTAVRDNSGNLSVYEYDDFGSLLAIRRGASWYGVTTDQLGTPRVVFDESDRVVKILKYDCFGQAIGDSNPEFELPINFAGGLIETDTKLVRFGFRDYDSVAGKWTAKDPIWFAGGDGNLYGYVINNPINLADPLGLEPKEVVIWTGDLTIDYNPAIYEAAINYRGSSTAAGPGGGKIACAWSVNNVLKSAGLKRIGQYPNRVDSVEADILGGRGIFIPDSSNSRPGDIAIIGKGDNAHIGICITDGCTRVLSNSSTPRTFTWESGKNFDGYYGNGSSRIYRVTNGYAP